MSSNEHSANATDTNQLTSVSPLEEVDSYNDPLQDEAWLDHSKRPEWVDVTPLSVDERKVTKRPIVEIAYSTAFKDTFDYLRAVMAKGESSIRAYYLTEEAVTMNPASYTAWHYRRKLIKDLKIDLAFELDVVSRLIADNPKNYQVWEHRRAIIEWKNDICKEFDFLDFVFGEDAKNYHAWQYRQWLVKHFRRFTQDELDFTMAMILKDIRNNSAWNHRYFLLHNCKEFGTGEDRIKGFDDDESVKVNEIAMCLAHLGDYCMNNESAWNYLRGLIGNKHPSEFRQIADFCENNMVKHGFEDRN